MHDNNIPIQIIILLNNMFTNIPQKVVSIQPSDSHLWQMLYYIKCIKEIGQHCQLINEVISLIYKHKPCGLWAK